MNKTKRQVLGVSGAAGAVLGVVVMIPTMLQGQYLATTIAGVLLVTGLVLLAISFGE